MTDRHAAEAVGLNPDSAAYTKAKPSCPRLHARAPCRSAATARPARGRPVPACRGGTAPPEPGPRTSTGPSLGNRQPQPRNDPKQHYRPGQGPRDDRGHAKPRPRPSRRLRAEEVRPCVHPPANLCRRMGVPGSRPKPSTRSQALPLPREKIRLPAPPVPACRGARRGAFPSSSSLPARRERRLRTLVPASPPSPTALPPRKPPSLMSPCSLQTREFLSL
jgi:hypothetical protein